MTSCGPEKQTGEDLQIYQTEGFRNLLLTAAGNLLFHIYKVRMEEVRD